MAASRQKQPSKTGA